MPSRGRKRQSEPAAPSHTLEQNGHTLTVVNHRLRGGSQKDGALQGGSQMESDKDGGSPRESSGNSKRKAPDPPSKSAKEFRWAPPLPLNLSSVPRGGKPSLMGVGSFAGVAAPLQNSGPPMPVLESPHSQGMLLSPRGGVAGDIFAGGGSESTGARAPLGSDKLPPKSPVLQALSNGQIMPQAPSLSGGSKGSALGGSGFLHPSMQGGDTYPVRCSLPRKVRC